MSLKKAAISGVKWSSASFVGRRALAFATNIILARLLTPADFGMVAMASVVLGFVELFKDLGTGSAVIQRKDISEALLSSIFWINAGFGLIASAVLYMLSAMVGEFYHEPAVAPLLQVLSYTFFISALGIVQNGLMTRDMAFEKLAKIELVTAIFSSVVAICAALAGFGVMSLVYQPLLNSVLVLLLLWGASPWRPRWVLHWGEVREVAGYSLNLTGSNLVNYLARNADNLLIGRYLGAQDLGYYDLAYRLMLYPLQGISAVVGKVLFPLYSQIQDDLGRFRSAYLTAVGAIALAAFPVLLGLFAVSSPFVLALFGVQWEPVITLLMIFAPLGALQSITTTVGSIYQAKGRTDWLLRWTLVASLVVMLAFVFGLRWGAVGVALAYTGATLILFIPGFAIPFRLIELRLLDLGKVLWRPFLCSVLMGLVVMETAGVLPAVWPQGVVLSVLIVWGGVVYLALTRLINRRQFLAVVGTLRGRT